MLARVAEHLFWLARYLERAENIARLVLVNTHLLLDLPAGRSPGWRPLITMIGADEPFDEGGPVKDEAGKALRFLLGDRKAGVSVLACLDRARENARVCRDLLPRNTWEQINALHIYASEQLSQGLSKRGQYAYLNGIIERSQTVNGTLEGTLNRDEGYAFLILGRLLERADMTTRIVDVRSADLLPDALEELRPLENLQWMSVLKSLSGYQMYRLRCQVRVSRSQVLDFLIRDPEFPRAVCCCLLGVEAQLKRFGTRRKVYQRNRMLLERIRTSQPGALAPADLHEWIDDVQGELSELADAIGDAFFHN